LIEEGTHKIESESFGKAFPAIQESPPSTSSGNKRKREDGDEDETQETAGKIFMTKNACKRWKQKERKKIKAEVYAANGEPGADPSGGGFGRAQNGKGSKGSGSKGGGKGKGNKSNAVPVCWICNKPGHKSNQCWNNPQNNPNNWNGSNSNNWGKSSGKGGKFNGESVNMANVMEMMNNMQNNQGTGNQSNPWG